MPISFDAIPSNWRIPLYWVEVDPSMAGLPVIRQPALLVGVAKGGNCVMDQPISIASMQQAIVAFGTGTQLTLMFQSFFTNSFSQEVWACRWRKVPVMLRRAR